MKILAIGRNYVEHIKELNNERPDEPVIFTKPDTALVRNNQHFSQELAGSLPIKYCIFDFVLTPKNLS